MEEVVRQRRFRFNFRGSLSLPFVAFMLFFVVVPLLLIVYFSLTDDQGHIYFENWRLIFTSSEKWKTILLTFEIAFATTAICILIAYPIAFILSNKKYNKNKILVYFFVLPMWVNFVVRTMALRDMVNDMFSTMFHFQLTAKYPVAGTILGMVYDYLPFAILPLYNQMLKMDKNQIEAAADLGANPVVVFFKVILPMTVPGIIAAATMTFMPTMSSYVVADQMGNGKVFIIGSLIENYVNTIHDNNAASILSLVMLFIIGMSLIVEKFFTKKDEDRKVGIW
jgi:spermidine/putrescine transport system permease protein